MAAKWQRRRLSFAILSLAIAAFVVLGSGLPELGSIGVDRSWLKPDPAAAQRSTRISDVQAEVYLRLPNLPKENHYVSSITGKAVPKNTLVDRLIRYHLYAKGRPAGFRFDWKLTVADYMGANEYIWPRTYPGHDNLTENPVDRDREVIKSLSRAERNALVQVLVDILNPQAARQPSAPSPTASPTPDSRSNSTVFPNSPKSGDAQLLVP